MTLIERALDGIPPGVHLVLENSAGAGQLCGGTIEELGAFVRAVDHPQLARMPGYGALVGGGIRNQFARGRRALRRRSPRSRSRSTDSRCSTSTTRRFRSAAHKDRHWHIGEGNIGFEGFRALAAHPELLGKTAILETPGDEADDIRNMQSIRTIFEGSRA